ncbi:MAG: flagellar hook-length control protein FliK [Clostridiales Family XIII bacterium]|jgi:flagellar hook-length control protein FliK|nr:flagellar hook-length control protein FliK [Clostridiales Family XIII bacterium]
MRGERGDAGESDVRKEVKTNMDVNLIGQMSGATNAANAANAAPIDVALFQSLIAAALRGRDGTALSGTALSAPGAGNAGEAKNADLSLLVQLLCSGGAFAAEGSAEGAEAVLSWEALLLTIAETPAEELIAASGRPEDAKAAELLANAEGILNALETAGARASAVSAADGPVNGAVAETRIANGEAAERPVQATLADELKPLLSVAASGEIAADATARSAKVGTAEAAVLAKAVRVEAPAADGETAETAVLAKATRVETPAADGEAGRATRAVSEESAILARDAHANAAREASGAETGRTADAQEGLRTGSAGESFATTPKTDVPARGDAAETSAANAAHASPQEGIATVRAASTQDAAQGRVVTSPEPYGQIANEIFAALAGKKLPTTLSMRLEPAELGRVDVSMRLTAAGKLVIDIAAESAKTQALLAGQTDKLVQALGLQNVQIESVNAANGTAFSGQQPGWAYADRSMAFFMDLAGNGGTGERTDRDGEEKASRSDRTALGISEAEQAAAEKPAQYARRLDLTA